MPSRRNRQAKRLASEIEGLRYELVKRSNDIRNNQYDLPIYGSMSQFGHVKQYQAKARLLERKYEEFQSYNGR